ncbi:hypothetical protein ACJMK2_031858 [Sinanodonta woodiana]|uniref:Mitochondria-eating protein n=1 Tax=Sinanodonta woodiana TaxID=1069815 RepID=A0ABD3X004_SINWO
MGWCTSSDPEETNNEESESFITQDERETRRQSNTEAQKREIAQLKSRISDFKKQVEELKTEKQSLVTRLSKICSVKLTDGNPNIADLSDPNRPDKLADQFSELYDNQWTDSFEKLHERLGFSEKNAIEILLKIVLTTYDICMHQVEHQNKTLENALSLFTGVKGTDQANESVIQESLFNLRTFRAKHYFLDKEDFQRKIEDSLHGTISSNECSACESYIAECIKICWQMCVKYPSMYMSAKTNTDFDHGLYTSYTTAGEHVSYVVWPVLFQYEEGPMLKRGIAQGTNQR